MEKKINIGCGNIPLENFYNLDKYYYPGCGSPNLNHKLAKEFKGTWVYGDAAKLEGLPNDYFEEVLMVHVLEHLSMEQGNDALRRAVQVMNPGGFIEVEVPDLLIACQLMPTVHIKKGQNNAKWFKVMGLLYGTTGKDGEGQFHLCGYTKEYLRFRLAEHGLKNIKEIDVGYGHGRPEPEYNFRLKAWK